jgi:hypothetical protein
MLKLSNLKNSDLSKIEQALNLLKNLKINDGNNELSLKSFNKANSVMTFVNQNGGEIKLDLNSNSNLNNMYSETSDMQSIRGGGSVYSETSDVQPIRGGGSVYSATSDVQSIRGGGVYSATSDVQPIRGGGGNGMYSATSDIQSIRGGGSGMYSETSINNTDINNNVFSDTSVNYMQGGKGGFSETSVLESEIQFNPLNLFIKSSVGGGTDDIMSLSSITELKERNKTNMSFLKNKGLSGGGVSNGNKFKAYDINSSSTNSVCE